MATLSTENIWMRVPRSNAHRFELLKESMERYTNKYGDHITNYLIYKTWDKERHRFEKS